MTKVTMTKSDALNLLGAINELPKVNGQLPTKFYYGLSKSRGPLTIEAQTLEDTMNSTIFKPFSKNLDKIDEKTGKVEKGSDGKPIKVERVPPEHLDEYNKKSAKFLKETTEVELHVIDFATVEPDMPRLQGVENIYLIFQYICNDKGAAAAAEPKKEEPKVEEKKEPAPAPA